VKKKTKVNLKGKKEGKNPGIKLLSPVQPRLIYKGDETRTKKNVYIDQVTTLALPQVERLRKIKCKAKYER